MIHQLPFPLSWSLISISVWVFCLHIRLSHRGKYSPGFQTQGQNQRRGTEEQQREMKMITFTSDQSQTGECTWLTWTATMSSLLLNLRSRHVEAEKTQLAPIKLSAPRSGSEGVYRQTNLLPGPICPPLLTQQGEKKPSSSSSPQISSNPHP